jgi:hypothetical protein
MPKSSCDWRRLTRHKGVRVGAQLDFTNLTYELLFLQITPISAATVLCGLYYHHPDGRRAIAFGRIGNKSRLTL